MQTVPMLAHCKLSNVVIMVELVFTKLSDVFRSKFIVQEAGLTRLPARLPKPGRDSQTLSLLSL